MQRQFLGGVSQWKCSLVVAFYWQQQRQHSNPVYRGQMVHNNYNTYNNNNMRAPRHVNRAPQSYIVTVPSGVRPGAPFQVNVAGELHVVTCPPSARPGMKVKIFV